MDSLRRFWNAFRDVAIVFSFIVNAILVFVLLVVLTQYRLIKDQVAAPLILGLDKAFYDLGESQIATTIPIQQQLPVQFALPVQFTLPLNQNTTVTTLTPTRISTRVNLSLGQYGQINGPITLDLPAGTPLQVHLGMNIPVSTTVQVNQMVPVSFQQPVVIHLGRSGLQPVVNELRAVLAPYSAIIQQLP